MSEKQIRQDLVEEFSDSYVRLTKDIKAEHAGSKTLVLKQRKNLKPTKKEMISTNKPHSCVYKINSNRFKYNTHLFL